MASMMPEAKVQCGPGIPKREPAAYSAGMQNIFENTNSVVLWAIV
jgi:hypothetical protein